MVTLSSYCRSLPVDTLSLTKSLHESKVFSRYFGEGAKMVLGEEPYMRPTYLVYRQIVSLRKRRSCTCPAGIITQKLHEWG